MKLYIFLTSKIGDIGGAQLYIKNKQTFLRENGWKTMIFYSNDKIVRLNELKDLNNYFFIPQLRFHPGSFSIGKQSKTLDKLKVLIGYKYQINDKLEIILESHFVNHSIWGEILGERLKAKHIVYLLSESFKNVPSKTLKFYDFKLQRKEIVGINKKSLQMLFKGYKKLKEVEKYTWIAGASINNVKEIQNKLLDSLKKKDVNIACISRLDKSYVKHIFLEVLKFANNHTNLEILFIIIGGTESKGLLEYFRKQSDELKNLTTIITGNLYPIPKSVFNLTDIFISSAGGGMTSVHQGALTLAIDVKTHDPIGFLGIDTSNHTFTSGKSKYSSVLDVLERIFIEKKVPKTNKDFKNMGYHSIDKIYNDHLKLVNNKNREEYYYKNNIKTNYKYLLVRFIKSIGIK